MNYDHLTLEALHHRGEQLQRELEDLNKWATLKETFLPKHLNQKLAYVREGYKHIPVNSPDAVLALACLATEEKIIMDLIEAVDNGHNRRKDLDKELKAVLDANLKKRESPEESRGTPLVAPEAIK